MYNNSTTFYRTRKKAAIFFTLFAQLNVDPAQFECHPLSFYVKNVNRYFINNTEMIFTKGSHHLGLPSPNGPPVVNVSGVTNFTMKGLGLVKRNKSEGGTPLPTSIITCKYHHSNKPRNGILFHTSSEIRIKNVAIKNCGANFTVDNLTIVSALSFRESYNVHLCMPSKNR